MGLTGNPFRVVEPDVGASLAVPWPPGLEQHTNAFMRGETPVLQLVGHHGSGKSTWLAVVAGRLSARGVQTVLVTAGTERLPPAPLPPVVLVDEAQWLQRREMRQLARVPRLMLCTHEDMRTSFGRQPVTVGLAAPDADHLLDVFAVRVRWAGGDPRRLRLDAAAARLLIGLCGRDRRMLELALYDVFQTMPGQPDALVDVAAVRRAFDQGTSIVTSHRTFGSMAQSTSRRATTSQTTRT